MSKQATKTDKTTMRRQAHAERAHERALEGYNGCSQPTTVRVLAGRTWENRGKTS